MNHNNKLHRRQVLRAGLGLAGGAAMLPLSPKSYALGSSAGWSPEDSQPKRIVLIELYGGNDGLETVVPFEEDIYHRLRPTVRIRKEDVLKIDDYRGFHPELPDLKKVWENGQMAIVEGTGYEVPVLSHFKSQEIWHTCREAGRVSGDGWVGRLRDAAWGDDDRTELVMHIGSHMPYSLHSSKHPLLAFEAPENYLYVGNKRDRDAYAEAGQDSKGEDGTGKESALQALRRKMRDAAATSPRVLEAAARYKPRAKYPTDDLGKSMRSVAAMIAAGFGTRVFSVSLGNFDTHGPSQVTTHAQLLRSLNGSVAAFLRDIKGTSAEKNTIIMASSEFGRRVRENASQGTDHGAAGPMFLFGEPIKGGLYGKHPSLTELDADENLIYTTDFRRVTGTVVEKWFGIDQGRVLPKHYETLPFLE